MKFLGQNHYLLQSCLKTFMGPKLSVILPAEVLKNAKVNLPYLVLL